jgi:hypothetical protein
MTGPRFLSLHPCLRRPWLLLPLLATVVFLPMACSSDQPTESSPSAQGPLTSQALPHPREMSQSEVEAAARASGYLQPEFSAISMSSGAALVNSGPKVLILADADGASTNALAAYLANAGFQVTVRPAPENTWDGTNPALTGYALVIHLNGFTWNVAMRASGQAALTSFVQNGGGFIGGQWNGYESISGTQKSMPNLVLMGTGNTAAEQNCGQCIVTYTTVPEQAGHPVLNGIPASFTFRADGHDAAAQVQFSTDPSTVLMRLPSGAPAVLVRQFGAGKVVNFSFSPNYGLGALGVTLLDPNILRLYLRSASWITGWTPDGDFDGVADAIDNCPNVANADQANLDGDAAGDACDPDDDADGIADTGDNCPMLANANQYDEDRDGTGDACEVQDDQTITFAQPADKTFGDADFSVTASASSTLPVTITASAKCTISGGSVHLTGAGECTLTAHQSGSTSYRPAAEVSRTFNIAKGTATVSLAGLNSAYTGSPVSVGVTTDPAGLPGVTVTYNGSGTPPTNPGSYAVTATLSHQDFQAAPATGTLIIAKATATITLAGLSRTFSGSPQTVTATTSPAGLGPITITYDGSNTPPVNAGSYSVTATLDHDGYQAAPVSGTLVISKASASISLGTEYVYDGSAKQAQVTTSPAGLSGVALTYMLDGAPVPFAINAGTYQVLAHLENPNYQAPDAIGTLKILQATPTINWPVPSDVKPGTKLGDAQLNASAFGVSNVSLAGNFVYTPAAGTTLRPGSYVLSVQFTPNDKNYTDAAATVSIEVSPSMIKFHGFLDPVKNPDTFNRVDAGQTVPLKFTLEGYQGSTAVISGQPSSTPISCKAVRREDIIHAKEPAGRLGLQQDGGKNRYKYLWRTDRSWAGSCRKMTLTLVDGSSHEALFRFTGKAARGWDSDKHLDRGNTKPRASEKSGKNKK